MIMFDVFETNSIPKWLQHIEQEIDDRMPQIMKEHPGYHPLDLRTEERTKIFKCHNAEMINTDDDCGLKSFKMVFKTKADYSWFMLRWG